MWPQIIHFSPVTSKKAEQLTLDNGRFLQRNDRDGFENMLES